MSECPIAAIQFQFLPIDTSFSWNGMGFVKKTMSKSFRIKPYPKGIFEPEESDFIETWTFPPEFKVDTNYCKAGLPCTGCDHWKMELERYKSCKS